MTTMLIRFRESITIGVGPMFGSKSLGLINAVTGYEAVSRNVLVIKPSIDFRFGLNQISSRGGISHPAHAMAIGDMDAIENLIRQQPVKPDVLAIDELQFFDPSLAYLVRDAAQSGIKILGAGLHRDYRGDAFPTAEKIMPLATNLTLVNARCMYAQNIERPCGHVAVMTQRLVNGFPDSYLSPTVMIEETGTNVTYEARCLDHWAVADMPVLRKF